MFNLQTGELAAAAWKEKSGALFLHKLFPTVLDDDDNAVGIIGEYGKVFDGDVDYMKLFLFRFLATLTVLHHSWPFRAIDVVLQFLTKFCMKN